MIRPAPLSITIYDIFIDNDRVHQLRDRDTTVPCVAFINACVYVEFAVFFGVFVIVAAGVLCLWPF